MVSTFNSSCLRVAICHRFGGASGRRETVWLTWLPELVQGYCHFYRSTIGWFVFIRWCCKVCAISCRLYIASKGPSTEIKAALRPHICAVACNRSHMDVGVLYDVTGEYDPAFYMAGAAIAMAGVICLPLRFLSRCEAAREGQHHSETAAGHREDGSADLKTLQDASDAMMYQSIERLGQTKPSPLLPVRRLDVPRTRNGGSLNSVDASNVVWWKASLLSVIPLAVVTASVRCLTHFRIHRDW